ncbi:RecQ family ATP-dependent DNA helicase [Oceanobacillus saliphilus]|uniref:RecQ family ATP-dependent DNA helicase n=1 Tax=Oceanobacillus saliphilus TaxID=2925834 RepID=UPI00201D424A|nr:ATP-dependent DNA helicase RecQ [Oceanobacillus saliphilus]
MQQTIPLEDYLQRYFHFNSFRTGQKEIIQDVLEGKDVLGILPTGSGKSICYQLPAIIQEGTTIVVSPLISLMIDQVKELKANNFKGVVAINSFMNPAERRTVYTNLGSYQLIYVSPELLQQHELISHLKSMTIKLVVIDEAHCISQWGHDFRPDYLKLSETLEVLHHPTVMALSATATPEVQTDIIHSLGRPNMHKRIYPMDRENIAFCMEEVTDDVEKNERIIQLFKQFKIPALIYFTSRAVAEKTAEILSTHLPENNIAFYHGGMEQLDRISIQQQFMNGQLDIICCTSAFGMGINKSNIRLIVHYHLPLQLESYIQEVGRAGRDGNSSVGLLLFSPKDLYIPTNMIKNELPDETDLRNLFLYLKNLVTQEKMKITETNEQIENRLQISEIQWKFFRYQLEKHGIIKNNYIIYDEEQWNETMRLIQLIMKNRFMYKQEKLYDVFNWIHDKKCLRNQLYRNFQSGFRNATYQCCSNCGFSWNKWEPDETETNSKRISSWQANLKKLLLIGEFDETE